MNFMKINTCDTINTISGVAVSLWVAGCPFKCDGCFNPETWNKDNGKEWTIKERLKLFSFIKDNRPYISTFSVLGGEPLAPYNRDEVLKVISEIRFLFPEIRIMIWTGYDWGDELKEIISGHEKNIDYLIVGQFVKELADDKLFLRGSSNQRIITPYGLQIDENDLKQIRKDMR